MPRPRVKPVPKDPAAIPPEWRDAVMGVPGYDPTKGADGCWFDPAAAGWACDFFAEMLAHIEGDTAGRPFVLEPWQRAVVANLFGWMRRNARGQAVRRFQELFLYVPRKNGKTPLAAGIGLYLFFCDGEPGQQGYVAAKDREQAGHLFRQMRGMVEANPELAGRCRVYGGTGCSNRSHATGSPRPASASCSSTKLTAERRCGRDPAILCQTQCSSRLSQRQPLRRPAWNRAA